MDWGSARGANFNKRPQPISGRKILAESRVVEEKVKVQNSSFDILRTEEEEDDDDEEEEEEKNEKNNSTEVVDDLATKTAELTVEDDNDDNWEVVGKK